MTEPPAKRARLEQFQQPTYPPPAEESEDDFDEIYGNPEDDSHQEPKIVSETGGHIAAEPTLADLSPTSTSLPGLAVTETSNAADSGSPIQSLLAKIQSSIDASGSEPAHPIANEQNSNRTANTNGKPVSGNIIPSEDALGDQQNEIGLEKPQEEKDWFSDEDEKPPSPEKVTDPAKQEFLEVAKLNKQDAQAEWQYDSSDEVSSSSGSSSDSKSDDSEDDEEYEPMDLQEQARILMQDAEDGGSSSKEPPRTANEQTIAKIEKPNVEVTQEMRIEELGPVEKIVQNSLVIRGHPSKESRVLESGSVLCLATRSIVGSIAETLGRVEEPYYSVSFNSNTEIEELGIEKNTVIYYVVDHAVHVFAQDLRTRGYDASNEFDEELGEDEVEFSDDEAEREHKKRAKEKRSRKRGIDSINDHRSTEPGNAVESAHNSNLPYPEAPIKYDDDEDADDMYTPLKRPGNLHELPPKPLPRRGHAEGRGRFNKGPKQRDRGRGGKHQHNGRNQQPSERGGPKQTPRNDRHNRDGQARSRKKNGGNNRGQGAQSSPRAEAPSPMQPSSAYGYNQYFPQVPQLPNYPPVFPNPQAWTGSNVSMPGFSPPPMQGFGYRPPPPVTPGANIPPGAFVNPAFFRNNSQGYSPPPPPTQPQYQYPGQYSSYHPPPINTQPSDPRRRSQARSASEEEYDPTRPWETSPTTSH